MLSMKIISIFFSIYNIFLKTRILLPWPSYTLAPVDIHFFVPCETISQHFSHAFPEILEVTYAVPHIILQLANVFKRRLDECCLISNGRERNSSTFQNCLDVLWFSPKAVSSRLLGLLIHWLCVQLGSPMYCVIIWANTELILKRNWAILNPSVR